MLSSQPKLQFLNEDNPLCQSIVLKFLGDWEHTDKPKPHVSHVFKITSSQRVEQGFSRKQQEVKEELARRGIWDSGQGMTSLRYHGTTVRCEVPVTGQICSDKLCSLCRIIEGGWQCSLAKGFTRFGKGAYFSAVSSKSHDYSSSTHEYLCILVAEVVLGVCFDLQDTIVDLDGPPPGFHSVIGIPGGDLNHDEVVIYEDAQARPAYMVVYEA